MQKLSDSSDNGIHVGCLSHGLSLVVEHFLCDMTDLRRLCGHLKLWIEGSKSGHKKKVLKNADIDFQKFRFCQLGGATHSAQFKN